MRALLRAAAGIAALSLATLGLSVPPAHAAIQASCMYPPSTPTLSIGLSTTAPVAGKAVYIKGRLRYNKCGVPGRPTTAKAGTKTLGTRTTDSFGYYAFSFVPLAKTSVSATSSFNGVSAKSRGISIAVRTNIRATFAAAGSCRISVRGTTYPRKVGATISLQRRLMSGSKFIGWSTAARVKTSSTGAFRGTMKAPCGARVGVSAFIPALSGNAANRTPTVTVIARR